jgi:hypothetical protein
MVRLVWLWGVWVLREVGLERCSVVSLLPYISMDLFVIVCPFVMLQSVPKVADLTLKVTLTPLCIEDLINHMLLLLGYCEVWLRCIYSLHNLVWCDRVELASVEHVVNMPSLGQLQSVCKWSHDLFYPEGAMLQGIQLQGWAVC